MPHTTSAAFHDKQQTLVSARRETQAELARLTREEDFLIRQIHEANVQLRHYEGLLAALRRDWGETPALRRILRRLD